MKTQIEMRIADWPEALWRMRHEMAQILREVAEDEDVCTADRLRAVAAVFEVGGAHD